MEFQIDFNRETRDDILEKIAYEREGYYYVDLPDFKAMEELENRIKDVTGEYYSLIVGFDNPTIFLDKDI
jgi:hypothetical protein